MIGPSMRCHPNPIFIAEADLKTTSLEVTRWIQSMPFPHILSQNLRRGKNSAGFWNQFEQESGLSKPNKSLQLSAQAVCTLFAENRENCMFLIIFKTGVNLCLVNCYCVCTVVNNLTLMKSAPLQYSSKRCNFDHRGVSAFQLST